MDNNFLNLDSEQNVSRAFDRLFPICRSILGDGYRQSLKILQDYIPLKEEYYPSGEQVLNWQIPKEWVIREAYIENESGKRIIDMQDCNLHVVNYSDAIDAVMPLSELKQHIYTSQIDENAIPYTMSYYKRRWGFCMSQKQLAALSDGLYHAKIDSEFIDGKLVTGECVLKGKSSKEILLSSYLCHPSMANNELSGPLVLAMLYQKLSKLKNRKFTYRFLINPETIGSIAYLSRHGNELKRNVFAGLVLTCLGGDEKSLRYKNSRSESSPFDLLVSTQNGQAKEQYRIEIFKASSGSDERQFCSPGFNLPIGQFARRVYGKYRGYHTSLDTKESMGIASIMDSAEKIYKFLLLNENEMYPVNRYPMGEVKLGDYDLYPSVNSNGCHIKDSTESVTQQPWFVEAVMELLNYADGIHPLSFIANKINISAQNMSEVAHVLMQKGLLEPECSKCTK